VPPLNAIGAGTETAARSWENRTFRITKVRQLDSLRAGRRGPAGPKVRGEAAQSRGLSRAARGCGRGRQIVDPYGRRLAEADATEETLLVANVEVEKARDKDHVVPGDYELYLFGDRRPELYGALVEEPVSIET
jgi:hypothetical protein